MLKALKYLIIKKLFIWTMYKLRSYKIEDIRAVKDNPKGTITFQGLIDAR